MLVTGLVRSLREDKSSDRARWIITLIVAKRGVAAYPTGHAIDDEIITWLARRSRRKRDRLAYSWQSAYKHFP